MAKKRTTSRINAGEAPNPYEGYYIDARYRGRVINFRGDHLDTRKLSEKQLKALSEDGTYGKYIKVKASKK